MAYSLANSASRFSWSRAIPATKSDLAETEHRISQLIAVMDRKLDTIMKTQAELAAQLRGLAVDLQAGNDEIKKVSGEQDTLLQNIVDLKAALANQTGASQELSDAVDAVAGQAATVKAGIQAVDDKVPDAPIVHAP